MRNTLVWAFAAVVIMALIGLGFAILLNREFTGRSVATTLLLLPWAILFISIALNWRLLYNFELGPLNGFLRLAGISEGFLDRKLPLCAVLGDARVGLAELPVFHAHVPRRDEGDPQ